MIELREYLTDTHSVKRKCVCVFKCVCPCMCVLGRGLAQDLGDGNG